MTEFYYHGWTSEEERILTDIMTDGLRNRKKTVQLFMEAANRLNRTRYSCQNRWYDIKNRTKAV